MLAVLETILVSDGRVIIAHPISVTTFPDTVRPSVGPDQC
jgi:hypothetical protein